MPRGLTIAQKAQATARVRRPVFFVELMLPTPVRAWTGIGSVTVLGNSFAGIGDFGLVDGVAGSNDNKSHTATIGIMGLPGAGWSQSTLADIRAQSYQGATVNIYLGYTNLDTDQPLFDPVKVFTGYADAMTYNLGSTFSVQLSIEGPQSRLRRANGLRMTTESHNARLGNPATRDLFFDAQNRLMGVARKVVS